jgi:hypothetical protein
MLGRADIASEKYSRTVQGSWLLIFGKVHFQPLQGTLVIKFIPEMLGATIIMPSHHLIR